MDVAGGSCVGLIPVASIARDMVALLMYSTAPWQSGQTPLHLAANNGHHEVSSLVPAVSLVPMHGDVLTECK